MKKHGPGIAVEAINDLLCDPIDPKEQKRQLKEKRKLEKQTKKKKSKKAEDSSDLEKCILKKGSKKGMKELYDSDSDEDYESSDDDGRHLTINSKEQRRREKQLLK